MRLNTINLQIVKNLGNYETLRIGAEWTPDSNQTLDEAMAAGMAELNAAADVLLGKKKPAPEPANDAQKEAAAEQAAAEQAAAEQAAAEQAPEPDALDKLNAEKDGDKRELVTLAAASKFNKTIGRLEAGIAIDRVCEHFRFDENTLAILKAWRDGGRVTIKAGEPMFDALIKAIEGRKDIANICQYLQFADEQTENVWNMAIKLCN